MSEDEFRDFLRRYCAPWGKRRELALEAKISEAYVSLVISGHRSPSDRLARAVGFTRVVSYERMKP